METVVSGIRSTGRLHLGNYFGALQNFVKLQDDNRCFFFIADYHSLTTHPKPGDLHGSVRAVFSEYLAAGLDPEKSTLFLQSDLPEVTELYLYLNMNAYLGELERSASFKDKVRAMPDNVNAGLLTYPTLMAADILIHKASRVPVGKDQQQHLEMTRAFAGRFNKMYEVDYFTEPQAFNFGKELVKVPGLSGKGKMGKSEEPGNAVFLSDSPEVIRKKVMKAVTDSGPSASNVDELKSEPTQNIFDLMALVSSAEQIAFYESEYSAKKIKYGDMKKDLAEDIIKFVAPISEKITRFSSDDRYIREVARMGAAKARVSARKTIKEIREIIGFKNF